MKRFGDEKEGKEEKEEEEKKKEEMLILNSCWSRRREGSSAEGGMHEAPTPSRLGISGMHRRQTGGMVKSFSPPTKPHSRRPTKGEKGEKAEKGERKYRVMLGRFWNLDTKDGWLVTRRRLSTFLYVVRR